MYVGDIGDNDRDREDVTVHRVEVGRRQLDVEPVSFRLAYPDGPHDAESLFADRAGRLHLITKSFGGGTVYRAPKRLQSNRVNVLEPVGRVRGYATDAALLRDGRHVLVRSLQQATVYTMPDLAPVGVVRAAVAAAGRGRSRSGRTGASGSAPRVPAPRCTRWRCPPRSLARCANPQAPTASASPAAVDPPGGAGVAG